MRCAIKENIPTSDVNRQQGDKIGLILHSRLGNSFTSPEKSDDRSRTGRAGALNWAPWRDWDCFSWNLERVRWVGENEIDKIKNDIGNRIFVRIPAVRVLEITLKSSSFKKLEHVFYFKRGA